MAVGDRHRLSGGEDQLNSRGGREAVGRAPSACLVRSSGITPASE